MSLTQSKFAQLGALIADGRRRAGLPLQADLALQIGCSQQTVSRWEAGLTRPSPAQLLRLEALLKMDELTLLKAAGYDSAPAGEPATTVSFDRRFPFDALAPESFEGIVDDLLRAKFPAARVQRAGATGHKQDGLDHTVEFADGTVHSFQTKRVESFGPAKVEAAVRAHTARAARKHLVLSRVASPQTAAKMREYAEWELWDADRLNREIRALPRPEQVALVDKYFPHQRFPLLGVAEKGPWQTPQEFFAPFQGKLASFSHDWDLVGREAVADQLVGGLERADRRGVLLVAAGGVGKSRLLKSLAARLVRKRPERAVFFLSPTEPVTAAALDDLGTRPKILVVDDAHERGDLAVLFAFAADPHRDVRLVLATRPYARARILGQAGEFALGDGLQEVELAPLSLAETTALAAQVLEAFDAPREFADAIARATRDCPLVTVLAARIAAKEKISLAQAQDHAAFRNTILGKFAKVLTGELGSAANQKAITEVLKVTALVQPFSPDDPAFKVLVVSVTHLDDMEVATTLRSLTDGGIFYRRGSQYRLMPDPLGDYIIEQNCIDANGRLTTFAERVLAESRHPLKGHVLVNLGRLDWRRGGGDGARSDLLERLWRDLKVTEPRFHDPVLTAAAEAAYYQPRQALDFVARQLRAGVRSDQFSQILRHVAFHSEHIRDACELLWEMGRSDSRAIAPNPGHAIRTLSELCAVEPDKPLGYNEQVIRFGLSLLSDPVSFAGAYTPFDFLKAILTGEGYTTRATGRTVTMKPFIVNHVAVARLRTEVIAAAVSLLPGPASKASIRAASVLSDALRYPMGVMGTTISDENRSDYTDEIQQTLETLVRLVAGGTLAPATMVALARTVSWHANYGPASTSRLARNLLKALPKTPGFQALCALADGFGNVFVGRQEIATWQTRLSAWIEAVASGIIAAHRPRDGLFEFLNGRIDEMKSVGLDSGNSEHVLILHLIRRDAEFAAELVERGLERRAGQLERFTGAALHRVIANDREQGYHWARRMLDSGNPALQDAVGRAFADPIVVDGAIAPEEREFLIRVLTSPHLQVVRSGLPAIGSLARDYPRLAIDMSLHVNLCLDVSVCHDAFMYLTSAGDEVLSALNESDVDHILTRLLPMSQLEDYWLQRVLSHLSRRFPEQSCAFLMRRVELAAETIEAFNEMRPVNYGPWDKERLRFRESDKVDALLERVWHWMVSREAGDWRFEENAAHLFDAAFFPLDDLILRFLMAKLATADAHVLHWIGKIVANAPEDFVFSQPGFVIAYLDASMRFGEEIYRRATGALYRSAMSGIRSGNVGQPFARDLKARDAAGSVLAGLSRMSPAYELYEELRRDAERNISHAHREAEELDDD